MDGGAWWATVHGVAKSRTRLSNFTSLHFCAYTQCIYLIHLVFSMGFPGGSTGEESACNAGDLGLIPGLGRSSGEGKGYPFQYSGLGNSMVYIVHGMYVGFY